MHRVAEGAGRVRNAGSRWSLTPRVLSIGQHYTEANALIELAQPHLLALAETTHESAWLATLDGHEVVYVARVPVRRIMSINVSVGTRVPAHATSMGRVLLAWAPHEQVTEILTGSPLRATTARPVTDAERLRQVLAEVRAQGYAIVAEELEVGLLSASAPVRDRSGAVVAALASSTSTGRSSVEQLRRDVAPLLVATADRISRSLGATGSAS